MNISKQSKSAAAAGAALADQSCMENGSMYLSFDTDSTMSSVAFKTLEVTTDFEMDDDDETAADSQGSHANSTLEADEKFNNFSAEHINTIKKSEDIIEIRSAVPKNILRDFQGISSTPTKQQLARSVEVIRGSEVHSMCTELGKAFARMEDEHIDELEQQAEDNKENAQPEEDEGVSTLSTSSSMEMMNSAIEHKITTVCTTIEQVFQEQQIQVTAKDTKPTPIDDMETILTDKPELKIQSDDSKDKNNAPAVKNHRRSVLVAKNVRKSVAEPDLEENRPSRIQTNLAKRTSLLPTVSKSVASINSTTDIPVLINKMLKISSEIEESNKISNKSDINTVDKFKTLHLTVKGSSQLTAQAEKRPYKFNSRMSTVVKTTLNSPARKIARKSIALNTQQLRRSVMMSSKLHVQPTMGSIGAGLAARKSMIPTGRNLTTATPMTVKTTTTTATNGMTTSAVDGTVKKSIMPTTKNRKSIYQRPLSQPNGVGTTAAEPIKPSVAIMKSKAKDPEFVCSVCQSKFRIKSLLDAHKRSHEDGTPPFVKKPTAVAPTAATGKSQFNNSKQCKYCDKKFALERALNIHLLQNCVKIPPGDKRKLHFTELNHVEKAQLPHFANLHNSNGYSGSNSVNSSIKTTQLFAKSSSISSTESLTEKKELFSEITLLGNKIVSKIGSQSSEIPMTAPTASIIKKNAAHTGVFRTPNKAVQCRKCKLTFTSMLEHISHNMRVHGNSKQNEQNTYDFMKMAMTLEETVEPETVGN